MSCWLYIHLIPAIWKLYSSCDQLWFVSSVMVPSDARSARALSEARHRNVNNMINIFACKLTSVPLACVSSSSALSLQEIRGLWGDWSDWDFSITSLMCVLPRGEERLTHNTWRRSFHSFIRRDKCLSSVSISVWITHTVLKDPRQRNPGCPENYALHALRFEIISYTGGFPLEINILLPS